MCLCLYCIKFLYFFFFFKKKGGGGVVEASFDPSPEHVTSGHNLEATWVYPRPKFGVS